MREKRAKKTGTARALGAKAASPRGKPASPGGQRTRLLKDLTAAIRQIDEEGLLFLLRQANVLIHNARVDVLNREAEELEKKAAKTRGSGAAASVSSRGLRMAGSAPYAAVEESPDGKVIFLVLGKSRKVMNVEEIKQLVRICYGAETKSDAQRQLFNVLARERKDVLVDAGIGAPASPILEALFHALREKYRLKDR
jgi:hypothetical protein